MARYCIPKGSRVFMKDGNEWREFAKPHKALCGRLVRVTSLKNGDIRLSTHVGIVSVRGHEIATSTRNLTLAGRKA